MVDTDDTFDTIVGMLLDELLDEEGFDHEALVKLLSSILVADYLHNPIVFGGRDNIAKAWRIIGKTVKDDEGYFV